MCDFLLFLIVSDEKKQKDDGENKSDYDEWIGVSLTSKFDGPGIKRPNLNLVFVLDISGSMSGSFEVCTRKNF